MGDRIISLIFCYQNIFLLSLFIQIILKILLKWQQKKFIVQITCFLCILRVFLEICINLKIELKKTLVKYIKKSILNTKQKKFFKNIILLKDMFQISFKF